MNSTPIPDDLPEASFVTLLGALLAAIAGAVIALLVAPTFLPALSQSFQGESPKAYWFFSRTSGFIAYGLLWLSILFGLLMTGKVSPSWPGHLVAFELHQFTSLLGLAFAVFHAFVLLGDRYIGYTLAQVLVPLGSVNYRPWNVGMGQVGLYLTLFITLTFYVRRWITQRVWRLIHYLSFATFLLVLAHGITSGSDSATPWAQALYWFTGGSVVFLTFYRILIRLRSAADRPVAATATSVAAGKR